MIAYQARRCPRRTDLRRTAEGRPGLIARRGGSVAALLLVGVLWLVACQPAAPPAAAPPPARAAEPASAPASPPAALVTVKTGHAGTFSGSPVYMARQRGYFAEEGIDLQLVPFKVSSDIIPAIATGEVDVATSAINPGLFNAVARGVSFTLVADLGSFQPGQATTSLVIRKDHVDSGRYRRPEDLRGMTIGVPGPYTVNHFMLALIAERAGFDLDEINITAVPMSDSLLALANGSLDGYYDVEPSPTIAVRDGYGVRVLSSDQVYEGFQSTVVFYGPSMLAQPDTGRRFMVAYLRGVRDYLRAFFDGVDQDRAIADITKEGIAVPRDVVAGGIDPSGRLNVASLEAIVDWWSKMGALREKPNVRAMIDEQYVDYALERLGPFNR
jgi:NitT/TauT family transport system substrate-binding protein